jgi:hypothetical protein
MGLTQTYEQVNFLFSPVCWEHFDKSSSSEPKSPSSISKFNPCLNGVRVAQYLVLCIVSWQPLFVFLSCYFWKLYLCPSSIYGLRLPLWYLRFMAYDYHFGILDLWLMITTLVSLIYGLWLRLWYLRFMAYDYDFGILDLWLMITTLVS